MDEITDMIKAVGRYGLKGEAAPGKCAYEIKMAPASYQLELTTLKSTDKTGSGGPALKIGALTLTLTGKREVTNSQTQTIIRSTNIVSDGLPVRTVTGPVQGESVNVAKLRQLVEGDLNTHVAMKHSLPCVNKPDDFSILGQFDVEKKATGELKLDFVVFSMDGSVMRSTKATQKITIKYTFSGSLALY